MPLMSALPTTEVGEYVAKELARRNDLKGHNRFEEYRLGPRNGGLRAHRTGHAEGNLRRVDLMSRAVDKRRLEIDDRKTR